MLGSRVLGELPFSSQALQGFEGCVAASKKKKIRKRRSHGWSSKICSCFGFPKDLVPYYNRDPKRDHKREKSSWKTLQRFRADPKTLFSKFTVFFGVPVYERPPDFGDLFRALSPSPNINRRVESMKRVHKNEMWIS